MKTSRWALSLLALVASTSMAATQDIAVTANKDIVLGRDWGYGGSYSWTDVTANPNIVSHDYWPGYGSAYNTALTFDLSSLGALDLADITGVTLNIDILATWSGDGRDVIGALSSGGSVYHSQGIGLKSFDVTSSILGALTAGQSSAQFLFSYTGYSGFTFGSADGGDPAFLRVSTVDVSPAVPEPESYALALAGLGVVGLLARRRTAQRG